MNRPRQEQNRQSGPWVKNASQRYTRSAQQETLHTAGELVEQGGLSGGLAILLYVVVGAVFWSLIGWLLDHLLGTRWIVIAGAVFGGSAGVYLGYLHMREALNRSHAPAENPIGDKDVV